MLPQQLRFIAQVFRFTANARKKNSFLLNCAFQLTSLHQTPFARLFNVPNEGLRLDSTDYPTLGEEMRQKKTVTLQYSSGLTSSRNVIRIVNFPWKRLWEGVEVNAYFEVPSQHFKTRGIRAQNDILRMPEVQSPCSHQIVRVRRGFSRRTLPKTFYSLR